jgi:hypothetical protein
MCRGPAHTLEGNTNLINNGRNGGFLAPVPDHSAAIIPRQWGAPGASTTQHMRNIGPVIQGWTDNGQSFYGLWDVINHAGIAGSAREAQNIIMHRYPGRMVVEMMRGRDSDTMIDLLVPGDEPCPENTSPR